MKLHTSAQLAEYCDNLETAKRYGAQFWREGFGVSTKEEARAIMPDTLDSYLRPELRNFAEILIQRFSVSASDARKDASKHLSNAFPTLKGIGIVTRKGPNAKPTKAYAQAGEDRTVTVIRDLENGETFSCCIAWQYSNAADISDATEVSPIMIGERSQESRDPDYARVVGTDSGRRYDVAYTPEAVSELVAQTVSRTDKYHADNTVIRNRNVTDLISLTLSLIQGYDGAGPSIERMYPTIGAETAKNATVARKQQRKVSA